MRRALMLAVLCSLLVASGAPAANLQSAPRPGLSGAWQQEGHSAMLIATATWVAIFGVDGLPALANYTIEGDTLTLQPLEPEKSFEDQIMENDLGIKSSRTNTPIVLQRFDMKPGVMTFVMANGPTLTWKKLE